MGIPEIDSGVTIRPRNPSGTNRMRLCGVLLCAHAVPADSKTRPADSVTTERRIIFPSKNRIVGVSAVAPV
jgi:hypothetical protein